MKTKSFIAGMLLVATMPVRAASNDLTSALQKGLFEEEANHNLDAAAQAYQAVSTQFDKDRKLAATAIFRLGEVYRKQGRTNEATAQYERIVREFPDQDTLAILSRQNLAGLGGSAQTRAAVVANTATVDNLQSQYALLKAQLEQARKETNFLTIAKLLDDQDLRAVVINARSVIRLPEDQQEYLEAAAARALDYAEKRLGILQSAIVQARAGQSLTTAEKETSPTPDDEETEIRRLRSMIENSPDLKNAPSGDPYLTPLCRAASKGQLGVAKFLLDSGAAIDRRSNALTPLHYAATGGHKAMVELLLARAADVNARDDVGRTPLHPAAQNGFQAVAEVLLANKAEVNAITSKQETPLHLAAVRGNAELVKALISKGADLDTKDSSGRTPLTLAATQGHSETVKALLAAKAKPDIEDNQGRTALSYGAGNGHLDSVKALLEAKADPNAGRTALPLHGAIHGKHLAIVEALLNAGADANRDSAVNWTVKTRGGVYSQSSPWPIPPLFAALNDNNSDAVGLLLKHKADPNWKGPDGVPLVFYALGLQDALKALLEAGADPNPDIGSGQTPLIQVVQWDNLTAVNLLLANGADKETKVNGVYSPLRIATDRGQKEIANALLQAGANVNATSGGDGRSALHQAVEFRDFAMTKLLLDHKADPNVRDASGLTPLDMAQGRSSSVAPVRASVAARPTAKLTDLADLLRQHGGLSDLPKLDRIEVRRPSANYSATVFWKGKEDRNRFTLLELIAVEYGLLTTQSEVKSDPSFHSRYDAMVLKPWFVQNERGHRNQLPFPDFSHVVIRRPVADRNTRQILEVDVLALLQSGDCSKDVPLNWGDVVEIAEADHPINEQWSGFAGESLNTLMKCLTRKIAISVKDEITSLSLSPHLELEDGKLKSLVNNRPFGLLPVLQESNLLRASSDLSRVKLTRRDPATGRTNEWVLDCSGGKPPDLWLRDGDVIEVPDKP